MKSKLHKILVLALALELLVSSIGVAQVSHLCKMALTEIDSRTCTEAENENHECCNMQNSEQSAQTSDDSCCKDQIKYYQNKVSGTVQEMYHSLPVEIIVITLLSHVISFSEIYISQSFFHNIEYPPGESGRQISLSINSLLI